LKEYNEPNGAELEKKQGKKFVIYKLDAIVDDRKLLD
jgi:hypothetical protein